MQKPLNFENQLEIVFLSLEQGTFSPALLEEIGLLETLSLSESDSINFERLLDLLPKILQYPDAKSVELLKVSLVHITDIHRFLEIIYPILSKLAYQDKHIEYAIDLTQICLQLGSEDDLFLLGSLYALYTLARNYLKAGEVIERIFKSSPDFDIQLYHKFY
jgi:tetratricopeptide (TPR) repeat protein